MIFFKPNPSYRQSREYDERKERVKAFFTSLKLKGVLCPVDKNDNLIGND